MLKKIMKWNKHPTGQSNRRPKEGVAWVLVRPGLSGGINVADGGTC